MLFDQKSVIRIGHGEKKSKAKRNGSRSPLKFFSAQLYLDLIFITSFYKTNIGNKRRKEAFKDHLIFHVSTMLGPETQVTLIYLSR